MANLENPSDFTSADAYVAPSDSTLVPRSDGDRVAGTDAHADLDAMDAAWVLWVVLAAFGTYFCMYAFRKPFTAGVYASAEDGGQAFKTILVVAQVLGYMLSKFVGVKVISEMPRERRACSILVLVAIAEAALVLFGIVPRPWNAVCMFLNGLPLGMVFGLVLGFLEGRRLTEALAAALCVSFIVADGFTKSVGAWLLALGCTESWMPAVAGAMFLAPISVFVWMLSRIPAPNRADVSARSERPSMTGDDRLGLFRRHAVPISLLAVMYLLVTVLRSFRADFAPELWTALGVTTRPSTFSYSEFCVALGVMAMSAVSVLVRDNRRAFFLSLATCAGGFVLIAVALIGNRLATFFGPFTFMVLVGLGLYLPYVAVHTTVFERLLAMTKDKGNIGFLMYVVDSVGYLGYVAVMVVKIAIDRLSSGTSFASATSSPHLLNFFAVTSAVACLVSWIALLLCWRHYLQSGRSESLIAD